jgi:hypothetical protein
VEIDEGHLLTKTGFALAKPVFVKKVSVKI